MAEHSKYKITERIDAGGMAEVFRGIAESIQGFKKSVAIKRILPHLCKNKKFISMFLDEARLSLHLQHANIVSVTDIGVSPGGDGGSSQYFIVMEFVDGTHLKGVIESLRRQGRTLPISHVLYLMMQVCNGLAYAHDVADPETGRPLGIVHRDISPPNILISKNGEVKLVDFGLAKATSQLESTDPGVVKGKFSYLSPEAANGREVDRRADIFAVGILLYELLTGKRLFYGENDYQTVELVRQARVPPMRQQNADVEPELEQVVRKALARDVNARYQTAGELQDSIAQYLFGRGMKVTSRDLAELVRGCIAERAKSQPALPQPKSLIDTLILEELNKFTSIEEVSGVHAAGPGAQPLSPEELSGGSPPGGAQSSDFIDTSNWSEELAGDAPRAEASSRQARQQASASSGSNGQPSGSAAVYAAGAGGHSQPNQQPQRKQTPPVVPSVPQRSPTPAGVPQRPVREPSLELGSLADLLEGDRKPQAPDDAQPVEKVAKPAPVVPILIGLAVMILLALGGLFWVMSRQH